MEAIGDFYSELRQTSDQRALPVTVRTLETVIRLSTAAARARLAKSVQQVCCLACLADESGNQVSVRVHLVFSQVQCCAQASIWKSQQVYSYCVRGLHVVWNVIRLSTSAAWARLATSVQQTCVSVVGRGGVQGSGQAYAWPLARNITSAGDNRAA